FAVAHGGEVHTKGLYLNCPRVCCEELPEGGRRHRHGFTRTELTLGLQPGDLREWLRYQRLTGLRRLPLLTWRIFETLLFCFAPLRFSSLLCLGPLSLGLKLLLSCQPLFFFLPLSRLGLFTLPALPFLRC